MKLNLIVSILLCFNAFSTVAQVITRLINHYQPFNYYWGLDTHFGAYIDSVNDLAISTFISDVPPSTAVFVQTIDNSLLITGGNLSFGDLGNLDTNYAVFYNSLIPPATVDTAIKYMGLKKVVQADTFYGWLSHRFTGGRLQLFPGFPPRYYAIYDSLLFIEVGWCATPNVPVPMGYITCNLAVGIDKHGLTPFILYPNPTNGKLNLQTESGFESTVRIYNLQGKILIEQKKFQDEIEINLSHLKGGIYFVEIETGSFLQRQKIVKLD